MCFGENFSPVFDSLKNKTHNNHTAKVLQFPFLMKFPLPKHIATPSSSCNRSRCNKKRIKATSNYGAKVKIFSNFYACADFGIILRIVKYLNIRKEHTKTYGWGSPDSLSAELATIERHRIRFWDKITLTQSEISTQKFHYFVTSSWPKSSQELTA